MPICFKPSGAAPGIAAATAIAAVTLAALTIASPGRAQTAPPGAGEPPPPAAAEAPPPATPPSTGQAPAAAAPPPPPPPGQTTGAPPLSQRPLARHRDASATVVAKVNLRRGPDTNSEILTTIPAGAAVRVGECDGEWCKVIWSGHSGFAITRNLNLGGQQRQAGLYPAPNRPAYPGGPGPGYPDDTELPGYAPGYYGPAPAVVYGGPAYYYGPRVYYYPRPWGWRRPWW